MPRIDIELTSCRPDGTWTWRAAGARQPRGVVAGSVLHDGAKVGDVVKAEADFDLDGINVTSVLAPKAKKSGPELLPVLGSGKEEELITHSPLRPEREGGERGRRGDRDRGDRDRGDRGSRGDRFGPPRPGGPGTTRPRATPDARPGGPDDGRRGGPGGAGPRERDRSRPERPGAGRPRDDRPGGDRPGGERPGGERPGRPRGERPAGDRRPHDGAPRERPARTGPAGGGAARASRPPAKRLQPGRAHRDAALAALAPEQRAIAEQVLRGGLAGVRQAVDEQNSQARAAGGPEIRAEAILGLAEELLPGLRAAEWRDRAEAASASMDEISLRDLRTVVAGADAAGRDDESRALATRLREGLDRRAAAERQAWVDEISTCLGEGRVVRALRVSSRAPEQGVRLPPEVASGLSQAAGDAMSPDTAVDRWMALLEAVLTSPVRRAIQPRGLPGGVDDDTRQALRQAVAKVPAIGPLLGEAPGRPVPPPPPRRPPAATPTPAAAPAAAPSPPEAVAAAPDPEPAPAPDPAPAPAPEPAESPAPPEPAAAPAPTEPVLPPGADPVLETTVDPVLAPDLDPVLSTTPEPPSEGAPDPERLPAEG